LKLIVFNKITTTIFAEKSFHCKYQNGKKKKKKGNKHLSAYSSNVAVSCQELISAMTDCIKKSSDEYDQLYGEKKPLYELQSIKN
jgi:hypothetical protein